MIQIQSTGSLPGSRRSAASSRVITALLFLLTGLGIAAAPHAQDTVSAVPEFIRLTEADLQSPVGQELAGAQEAFRSSLTDDPAQALEIAKGIVALTAETYGDAHPYVSQALTNLAIVQAANTNFGAAIENYLAAIRSRERESRTLVSRELINPLIGLAGAYMALDEIGLAIPIYERAIHISHVNDGPNNLSQVDLIDALSRAYFFEGELETASDMQDAIFRLRQRHYEEDPDQIIDALSQRSAWYARLGNQEEAVRFYRRLERTISRQYGSEDVRLIDPLISLANAAILVTDAGDTAISEGRRSMARAVRIARANKAANPELFARTLVQQGDWLAALNQTRQSRLPYREAWNTLNADPALHNVRDELFAAPVPVVRVRFRPVYGQRLAQSANPDLFPQRGFADVAFDVDPLGRPTNVRIVEANPAGLMDGHIRRQIRRFRFRPAFSNGQPTTYAGVSYRHPFRYNEASLSDKDREVIAATSYEGVEPATSAPSSAITVRRKVNLGPDAGGGFVRGSGTVPAAAPEADASDAEAPAESSDAETEQPAAPEEDAPATSAPTPGATET